MHYVCDFSCYVHTDRYTGTLKEHRAYEEAQAAFIGRQRARDIVSFYGAGNGTELGARLAAALDFRADDTFSPEQDLDFAFSLASALCREMLRLSESGQTPLGTLPLSLAGGGQTPVEPCGPSGPLTAGGPILLPCCATYKPAWPPFSRAVERRYSRAAICFPLLRRERKCSRQK